VVCVLYDVEPYDGDLIVTVYEQQDLIKCTPTSHADYDLLQNTLSSAQNFIESFDGTSYKEQVRLSSFVHVVYLYVYK